MTTRRLLLLALLLCSLSASAFAAEGSTQPKATFYPGGWSQSLKLKYENSATSQTRRGGRVMTSDARFQRHTELTGNRFAVREAQRTTFAAGKPVTSARHFIATPGPGGRMDGSETRTPISRATYRELRRTQSAFPLAKGR